MGRVDTILDIQQFLNNEFLKLQNFKDTNYSSILFKNILLISTSKIAQLRLASSIEYYIIKERLLLTVTIFAGEISHLDADCFLLIYLKRKKIVYPFSRVLYFVQSEV